MAVVQAASTATRMSPSKVRRGDEAIDGWTATPGAWNLGNASQPFVVMRDLSGVEVPHGDGHNGLATDVFIG